MNKTANKEHITNLYMRYRLLYILRDLGIKSSNEMAKKAWITYVSALTTVNQDIYDMLDPVYKNPPPLNEGHGHHE